MSLIIMNAKDDDSVDARRQATISMTTTATTVSSSRHDIMSLVVNNAEEEEEDVGVDAPSRRAATSNSASPTSSSSSSSSSSFGILNLFLGRTPEVMWDLLTVRELVNLRCISKTFRNKIENNFEYLYCRDGKDYVVPYPGFPGLLKHNNGGRAGDNDDGDKGNNNINNVHNNDGWSENNNNDDGVDAISNSRAGLYPHQLASLRAMYEMENRSNHFGALRGGVLGDAPGLGKTITSLALISSTAGIRPRSPPEFWNTNDIQEGWECFRINPAARIEILKCLKPVRDQLSRYCPDELDYITVPFNDGNKNNDQNRFPTLKSYEEYIYRLLRKGEGRYGVRKGEGRYGGLRYTSFADSSTWELVRQNLLDLQMGMDKRNRKLMMSMEGRRLLLERRLIPTSATLLVVPDALFEHWFQQIQQHLYLPIFADDAQENQDGTGTRTTPIFVNDEQEHQHGTRATKNIARGVVYLDGLGDLADVTVGDKVLDNTSAMKGPILSSHQLSGYLIVIITFSRCKKEVRDGRVVVPNNNENKRKRYGESSNLTHHRSPLLQLRWLRLMVDEGHQLETDTSLIEFINEVAAERRWVISGTPLVGNEDHPKYNANALDQLQRIQYFLRHPLYGFSKSNEDVKKAWEKEVKIPFLKKKNRDKILHVLKEIMVMHRKEDLKLPEPIFQQIEVEVDIPIEVESTILQSSPISLVDLGLQNYLYSPEFQSLVDKAMATYILNTIHASRTAQRQVCNNRQTFSCDRRPIKAVVYSSSNKDLLSVSDSILRKLEFAHEHVAELYENSSIGDMSSELERFRHGVSTYRKCPLCKHENGMLQSRCDNDLMEVVSIESKQRFLIEPQRVLNTINVPFARLGGESLNNYTKSRKFWRVGDKLNVDIRDPHPILPKRKSERNWKEYGSERCKKLATEQKYEGRDWYFGPLPANVINFEQPGTMEVELVKWQKCGNFHSSRWYKGPRFGDAPAAKRKEDTFLLCLDANLSAGLDLSFVTHIFLLEAINDAALLEQVTSRAHRLGATGPVTIDTIHVFYKCSEGFQETVFQSSSTKIQTTNSRKTKKLPSIYDNQNREKTLNKIVCHHCYRQFDSYPLAEEHERSLCKRNPSNTVTIDRYHLSSVYKEIRPPLPMLSSSVTTA